MLLESNYFIGCVFYMIGSLSFVLGTGFFWRMPFEWPSRCETARAGDTGRCRSGRFFTSHSMMSRERARASSSSFSCGCNITFLFLLEPARVAVRRRYWSCKMRKKVNWNAKLMKMKLTTTLGPPKNSMK